MDLTEINSLRQAVLWASFGAAFAFGAVAQRTNFCTMGAISDVFNMGSWTRMRMWAMAIGVAMIGFQSMAWMGWLDPSRTIYATGRVPWLSALGGGALFGFGMVLASGCGSKTLVRIGEGSLKSLVVFVIMGLAAFASMRGGIGVLRSRTVDQVNFELPSGNLIPAWVSGTFGVSATVAGLLLALVVGGGLIAWAAAGREFRSSSDNFLGGIGIGAVIVAMWWVVGRMGFIPEHPETLEATYIATVTGRIEALSFTSPMARTLDWLVLTGDFTKPVTLGMITVTGVVLGALAYAIYNRSFHWEGFNGTRDTALHIAGAACMGVGGVAGLGCTVGQGLSGISTLSITSVIALAGIMLGGVAGLRFQLWLLMRD